MPKEKCLQVMNADVRFSSDINPDYHFCTEAPEGKLCYWKLAGLPGVARDILVRHTHTNTSTLP